MKPQETQLDMNNANEQLNLGPFCGYIGVNDFGLTKNWQTSYFKI